MFGPVFAREVVTAPRRARLYVARSAYVAVLLTLVSAAWQVLAGTQQVRNLGDLSRFGAEVFQILAPLELAVIVFFAALAAAGSVAQEKDRRTLELLLLSNLTNAELVLGKLLASLLSAMVLLAAAVPLFFITTLLGGVAYDQILLVVAVTLLSAAAAASLGSTLALWREKTFQALALTALVLVFWALAGEIVGLGGTSHGPAGMAWEIWAAGISPWRAIAEASRAHLSLPNGVNWINSPVYLFLAVAGGASLALNVLAIAMVRVWNPSEKSGRSEDQQQARESIRSAEAGQCVGEPLAPASAATRGGGRQVWDNPILWREMMTWAYGRKVVVIRLAFLALFVMAGARLHYLAQQVEPLQRFDVAVPLAPLFVLSLMLINAQAVTAMTTERDVRALDLLLVTELTPKEIIYGKLGGVLYNAKEMVLAPIVLCGYLWYVRELSGENLMYLIGGLLVMDAFAAMLGIHAGMTYVNSRNAIAVSIGTVFFLFIGIAVCMRIMVAFSGSFQVQLPPFLAFIVGGGIGLYAALGARNPSPAIAIASGLCPLFTFHAITSFMLGATAVVFIDVAGVYGFATAAMLIPAIYEFDVATGRTTAAEE